MRIKAIWIVACIQIVVSSAGQDRLTRIGGMTGGSIAPRDPAAVLIEATSKTPMKVRATTVSAAEMKPIFDEQIASMYAVDESGAIVQTKRYRYGYNGWERELAGYAGSRIRIIQHFEGQRYLAQYGVTSSSMFVIDLAGGPYADDTTLRVRIEDTGQVYSYTSVLGAKNTVRVMQSVPEPSLRPISYEDFVKAVKDGSSFEVLRNMNLPCPECQASGFVKVNDRDGRLGVRKICPVCKSRKKIERCVLCRIAFE